MLLQLRIACALVRADSRAGRGARHGSTAGGGGGGGADPRPEPELAYLNANGKAALLESTVGQLLGEAAQRWPDRDYVVSLEQNARLTYAQLLGRADALAAGLRALGLRRGERIGLWSPNLIEWPLVYLAGVRAGLIVAGLNPAYRQAEIEYCLERIGVRAVLAPNSYRDQNYARMLCEAKGRSASLEHVVLFGEDHVAGTRRLRDVENLANKKDIEAVAEEQIEISPYSGTNIQFTSGTTGKPKAVLLAHRSLVNNSKQVSVRFDTTGRKTCLNVPYFHAFGMMMGVVGSLHSGSTVVIASPIFNPVKSLEAIVGEKCSVTYGTPTMWINMIDVQSKKGIKVDTLYGGLVGGAPASPSLYQKVREHLRMDKIKNVYGLTEITAVATQSLPDESIELTDNTVGYISDNTEMKVVDDNGNTVPFGTPGELCTRGYNTMIGYWNDQESTNKILTKDQWLKTGDQFVLRKDGYGVIVGRLKDMLIRGGENIFPKEIEDFFESHPDIIEVQAFGVYDEVYGQEICASMKLRKDAKLTVKDVVEYAKGKIARFKIPRYVEFRDEFPKTTSGKIQKSKLKQELEDQGFVPKEPKN